MGIENLHSIDESTIHLEQHLPKIEGRDLKEAAVNCVFYREHVCLAPSQTYLMCKNCSHCNNLPLLAARDIFQRIIGTAIMMLNQLGFSISNTKSVGQITGDIDDTV